MRRISVLSPQWRITVPFLVPAIFKTEYAPVMELVDMRDLGSRAFEYFTRLVLKEYAPVME